jgi:acyl-coenzyme A synthetase/AMP-(fatty) acid ligase
MNFLIDGLPRFHGELAIAERGVDFTYDALQQRVSRWQSHLAAALPPGQVVSVEGDYGVEAIALFLALVSGGHTVVPLSPDSRAQHDDFLRIAEVEYRCRLAADGVPTSTGVQATHAFYRELRERHHPGLVLFSSGSTGRPKAAVHDLVPLLEKFRRPRHRYRTLVFLQLDHIGGINTLFYTVANGGAVVVPRDRSPLAVCEAIEKYRVELLPTSPTFLNLLLLSGEHLQHDLSSLTLITYGTEPMPESTLLRLRAAMPNARLLQTYGLSELGILRSESRSSDSLWVRVGGEAYETKIVDGRLFIRSKSAMLGYLNAPSPFDDEGFFDTGDLVESDGEWIRILGRKSEIINVGGRKVHPAEVESALLAIDNVVDASVRGEPHPITGQIVTATVRLASDEPIDGFKVRARRFCRERLEPYKIPVRFRFAEAPLYSARYKRIR